MKPLWASGWLIRSATASTTISSGQRSPRSMMCLTLRPTGVAALTAARNMSPVESWMIPYLSTSRCAWVPLPAPGGPRRISLIGVSPQKLFRAPSSGTGEPTSRAASHKIVVRCSASPSPRAAKLRALDQSFILVGKQVALHLGDGVHGDADDDQERRSAEVERHRRVGD